MSVRSTIAERLSYLYVGRKQSYKNLAIFPILSRLQDPLEYLVLDEAVENKKVEITEVDANGSVPELKLRNYAHDRIFIVDGEELVGAKQNRIVNASILVPPRREVHIPVSCVEQGRWSYTSDQFTTSKIIYTARARRTKHKSTTTSLKLTNSFVANQSEVWNTVSTYLRTSSVDSQTMAFQDFYKKREDELEKYVDRFSLARHQVGSLVFVGGEFMVFDLFGRTSVAGKIYHKLVRSYAMDALDRSDEFGFIFEAQEKPEPPPRIRRSSFSQWRLGIRNGDFDFKLGPHRICRNGKRLLAPIADTDYHVFKSIGNAFDVRFEGDTLEGTALLFGRHLIHMSFFPH